MYGVSGHMQFSAQQQHPAATLWPPFFSLLFLSIGYHTNLHSNSVAHRFDLDPNRRGQEQHIDIGYTVYVCCIGPDKVNSISRIPSIKSLSPFLFMEPPKVYCVTLVMFAYRIPVVCQDVTAGLPDFDEDARVTHNDGQAGDEESKSEEELFGGLAF